MKLFLIRHGQSVANLHSYYAGQMDMPLTELGISQAAAIAPLLAPYRFDKVYSSDLSRAKSTCENALPGVDYETLALLREYDVGRLEGVALGSVPRIHVAEPEKRPDYTDYDGENALMVCARAKQFLEMLEGEPHEYVAAFSHFGFINCLLRTILGAAYDSKRVFTTNCSVHVVEFDGKQWRILALNYGLEV